MISTRLDGDAHCYWRRETRASFWLDTLDGIRNGQREIHTDEATVSVARKPRRASAPDSYRTIAIRNWLLSQTLFPLLLSSFGLAFSFSKQGRMDSSIGWTTCAVSEHRFDAHSLSEPALPSCDLSYPHSYLRLASMESLIGHSKRSSARESGLLQWLTASSLCSSVSLPSSPNSKTAALAYTGFKGPKSADESTNKRAMRS